MMRRIIFLAIVLLLGSTLGHAVITVSQREILFGPSGPYISSWTFSTEAGKERREQRSEAANLHYFEPVVLVDIVRPDLGRQWHYYPHWKKYTESTIVLSTTSSLTSAVHASTSPVVSEIGNAHIRIESHISGPGKPEQIAGHIGRPYSLTIDWIASDRATGKELRRYMYREKIWTTTASLPLLKEFQAGQSNATAEPKLPYDIGLNTECCVVRRILSSGLF